MTPVATLRFIAGRCNDVADGLSTGSGQVTLGFWHKADITAVLIHVRFWGFGAHILILQEFSTFRRCYPHGYPPGRILLAPRRFPAA